MKTKHLDATGKGLYSYDYLNNTLVFKIKDRDYDSSIEFGNLVADIDKEGFITGLRLFDASKVFGLSKISLKNLKDFKFDTKVEKNVVTIRLQFVCVLRNKPLIRQGQDFVREVQTENIKD